MATLGDLRFDETTWKSASAARRAEWKVLLADLKDDGDFAKALSRTTLVATVTAETVLFEATDKKGRVVASTRLAWADLAEPIDEYAAIIRRLDGSQEHVDSSWFQAVDIAKKVVHDRAARILERALSALSTDATTLRRMFSVLFSLRIDTSVSRHAHRHGGR